MDIRNTFLAGKLNLDADIRLIKQGEYRDALNIRIANSEGSDVGAIEKSLSNKQITTLELGNNAYTLCALRDEFEEKIYWAVLSDTGCYIIEHEVATGITVFVLKDTRVGIANELGFVPDKRLQMVLIVDSDNDNRLLSFTDNNTQPKLINVERAKTYGENGFNEEMILLIKKPPLFAPTIALSTTPDLENNLEERFLRFAYRYKYLDGEYSALSPLSDVAFQAKTFSYDYGTGTNKSMLNVFNTVDININTGTDLVTDLEIVFKESGSNNIYLIEVLNKADKSWADNTSQVFNFTNNKIYQILPEKEVFRLYDNVPLLAKAIAVINNRIVFGNYTENYNIETCAEEKIVIDITTTKDVTAITNDTPTKSIKSNRDYEGGIVYLDEYGRMTTPLTSEGNTVHIPNNDSINQNKIKIKIAHEPPCFAKYYRFFIKQNKTDYDTLLPSLFYEDEEYRWIKLEKSDIDKIKEGDYLVVKADSSKVLTTAIKTKVLEIKQQPENFLQPIDDVINEFIEKPGLYFKIKPEGFSANKADYYTYYLQTYHNSKDSYENCLRNGTAYTYPAVFYGTLLDDMTVATTNTLTKNVGKRFKVLIDNLQLAATGNVELTGGASGSIDSITVNGVEIMSGIEVFDTNLDTTASNVAANITSNSSSPDYTAIAVGSLITITSVTKGATVNGFAILSSATTITTSNVNMSGGSENTFKWNDDNSGVYPNTNIPITAGVGQVLSDGVTITFISDTGHASTDEWNFYACGKLESDDSRAYGWFKTVGDYGETLTSSGLTLSDEVIENGAVIDLKFLEYGSTPYVFEINETSNNKYDNIMEWYFREDIATKIQDSATSLGYGAFDFDHLYFMRGVVDHQGGSAELSTFNTDGFMTMVVRSQYFGTSINRKKVSATTNIFQTDSSRLIFETDPTPVNEDIFFEIGQTYPITNGFHIGNGGSDINQELGVDAEIILPFFNCWAWGNAVESYKVKDEFNSKTYNIDTRPSVSIKNYRQNKRIASFTWSNVYEQTTNYNALNEFNLALANYKDLDDKNGSIQAMVSWNTDLDVWQEDKVHKILFDKVIIYNQDGSSNLSKSDNLFDGIKAYAGEYGISTHPESLVVYGNYTYWADAKRGVFLRKGQSGIEIISNFGIKDWTRDAMINLTTFILGSYDPYFGQYVVSLNGKTITFDEKVKGWTSFYSWIPDDMVRINNRFYTIKNGQLYLHNDITNGYNNFYGSQYSSKVTTVFNQESQYDKILKTIITEGDSPWNTTIVTNLTNSSISRSEFNNRESRWFGYVRRNENEQDLNGVSQGIGRITNINVNSITFGNISETVSIGDKLFQLNGSVPEEIGDIDTIEDGIVTIYNIVTSPTIGLFCFSKKDSRINGSAIRGYYIKVILEDDTTGPNELFAVTANVVKSYL
ncbi:hypothetical protein [Thalassobellus suaedae]|uniref:Uncharacterized protein n=1 Tax=Thalassobellus suaedae TaxID=3074124 RepID=A0ABY9XW10_9FLAO|nr:hypothetical protein RHP51_04895 [Flavobacteriaceae bacterium HL-DH14]